MVADLLSSDAVRVSPGDPVRLEQWGGGVPLEGRVRRIEPSGFMKVSALGVEEQRVNVIVEFADPAAAGRELGDGYRVEVRVIVWQDPRVLKVPVGSLFRRGESWAVFVVENGRAVGVRYTAGPEEETAYVDGEEAGYADYVLLQDPPRVLFPHTVTHPAYGGRGVASQEHRRHEDGHPVHEPPLKEPGIQLSASFEEEGRHLAPGQLGRELLVELLGDRLREGDERRERRGLR